MVLNCRGTLLLVGSFIAVLALLLLLAILSRDAYPAPNVPAFWLTITGGLLTAFASVWLMPDLRKPLENPLKHILGSLTLGAILGGCMVSVALDAFVHYTARQLHTGWVSYAVTPGWKNCLFGVAFEDPVLLARIRVCGPRWKLPVTPNAGVLYIAEASDPYGVVLQQVTAGNEPSR